MNYPAPEVGFPFAHRAGETGIGVNPRTGATMFQMTLDTARVTWDASGVPRATWRNVSAPINSTNDPILWTDPVTGRTFVVQLFAPVGSLIAYTDDDGETWQLTEPGIVLPSWDHQSIGGGSYSLVPDGLNPIYPNVLWYCAQPGTTFSQCARSDDGGLTWGAPLPMNLLRCSGLHGHVAVDASGTVYVPHKSCSGRQGLIVSSTEGAVWEPRTVPGTVANANDPKVAFDRSGRLYFAAVSAGRAVAATSTDSGRTWTTPVDVGAAAGIQNAAFPTVVAGDGGRAAVGFFGTTTPGNSQAATFTGVWHQYVAYTFDAGATWELVDVTGADPVQRGCIWLQGGSNPCRNLLDFQDMTIDTEGRVLVSYADGCTSRGGCNDPNATWTGQRDSRGVIARQTAGRRMYAAFDPPALEPLGASTGGPYTVDVGGTASLAAQAVGGAPPYSFAWDFDDDGAFDDAAGPTAAYQATVGGLRPVAVRATDGNGTTSVGSGYVRVRDVSLQAPLDSWTFEAGGVCSADGWTVDSFLALTEWHLAQGRADSAPCAWYHGSDADGRYSYANATAVVSPGGPDCIDLPETLASASFELRVTGAASAFDELTVEVGPCGDPAEVVTVATFGGVQGNPSVNPPVYVTRSADVSAFIGRGPVQVRVRFRTGGISPLVPNPVGYRIDSFRLLGQ